MATWPSEIKINKTGFKYGTPDRVLRSKMDVGPGKQRRRSSNAVRPCSFSLFLNDEQLEIFDTFYLENDAFVFDFPDPVKNSLVRARFVEAPQYDRDEEFWRFSVKLEILP